MMNILADPFVQTGALAAVGAVITRVFLRRHPKRRLIGQLGFFLALTALLLYHGIIPYKPGPSVAPVLQRVFIAIAKIIWWTNAAWSLISIVRVFLIFEVRLLQGCDPPKRWGWCYIDEVFIDIGDRITPQNGSASALLLAFVGPSEGMCVGKSPVIVLLRVQ